MFMVPHPQLSDIINQLKDIILSDLENLEFNLRTEKNLNGITFVTKEYSFYNENLIISQHKDPDDDSGDLYRINAIELSGQWGPNLIDFIEKKYDQLYGYKDDPEAAKKILSIIKKLSSSENPG